MMREEILFAGFGGQGIMLMGQLLAYGAIHQDLEVTFFPAYGPEMRGGTANCTVILSDRPIGSPVQDFFTTVVALNQPSADRFVQRLRPGGSLLYDDSLVSAPPDSARIARLPVPASRIARQLETDQVINMAMLGAVAARLRVIALDSLEKGLSRILPAHRHDLIPINCRALKLGHDALSNPERSRIQDA